MAIGCPVSDFLAHFEHDGSHIQWPQFSDPKRRRGFHHQECILAAWRLGFATTQFELRPRYAPDQYAEPCTVFERAFSDLVFSTRGVLTGATHRCGHAVSYDHGQICDCRGKTYGFGHALENDFSPSCVFVLTPRHQ
jgi:hypothetical protein